MPLKLSTWELSPWMFDSRNMTSYHAAWLSSRSNSESRSIRDLVASFGLPKGHKIATKLRKFWLAHHERQQFVTLSNQQLHEMAAEFLGKWGAELWSWCKGRRRGNFVYPRDRHKIHIVLVDILRAQRYNENNLEIKKKARRPTQT